MPRLFSDSRFIERRRELRRALTLAEATLWLHLQRRQLDGRKFRRQHSIGAWIVDFYCPSERRAVELDGAPHEFEHRSTRDAARDAWLSDRGVRVVRFRNDEVRTNLDGVLAAIRAAFRVGV